MKTSSVPEDCPWQEPVRGYQQGSWEGLGWLQGEQKAGAVMERGHKNSGSQALSLETVPSMGFQPWPTSLKVGSYLLWGPLKKEIYTQPIGNLITTPCISGDLGFMFTCGLGVYSWLQKWVLSNGREGNWVSIHTLFWAPIWIPDQCSWRENRAQGPMSKTAGTLGTAGPGTGACCCTQGS